MRRLGMDIDTRPAELLAELSKIRKFTDSEDDFDPKTDTAVGVLPESLKKLFTLWRRAEKLAAELSEQTSNSEKEAKELARRKCAAEEKEGLLYQWFFSAVRDQFGMWDRHDCPCIGIRRGFLVVKFNPEVQKEAKQESSGVLLIRVSRESRGFSNN